MTPPLKACNMVTCASHATTLPNLIWNSACRDMPEKYDNTLTSSKNRHVLPHGDADLVSNAVFPCWSPHVTRMVQCGTHLVYEALPLVGILQLSPMRLHLGQLGQARNTCCLTRSAASRVKTGRNKNNRLLRLETSCGVGAALPTSTQVPHPRLRIRMRNRAWMK